VASSSRKQSGIKEVARVAGVSVTTVSHALNGKGRINAETRERVQRVADDLGYRPSNMARNLVSRRTGRMATELLVARVEGKDAVPPHPILTRIVPRNSTRHSLIDTAEA
jgi:DNA-binding LacI/PurR family transcriptional regulator